MSRTRGVVVSLEPLTVCLNRERLVAAAPADVAVGDVVGFELVEGAASKVKRVAFRPLKAPRRYPIGLKGLVVAKGTDGLTIVDDSGLRYRRNDRSSAVGGTIQVGDRVSFRVMSTDMLAWDLVRTKDARGG